nr:tRNA 2-selenouridine(34) synthase MnmH [Thiolinea sp.]
MLKPLGLSPELPVIEDLHAVLVAGRPLLDVRAPVEFAAGAFPGATNLPLMNDAEREAVGRCYKQAGQDAAIALGLEQVSGAVKTQRIAAWKTFLEALPAQDRVLYCFRGGLRSRIAQQWILEHTGMACPRIKGGYKAMRRYLLDQLDVLPGRFQGWVLSGRTGSGKTRFLNGFRQQIDLEGLANHRGSAFGPNVTPQPTQIAFENALAIALLRQQDAGWQALLFEDESRNIGSVHLPP